MEINNKSQQINLSYFFEDSKIIFKRFRENRQEIISKMKQPSISCDKKYISEQKLTNIISKKRANTIEARNKNNFKFMHKFRSKRFSKFKYKIPK